MFRLILTTAIALAATSVLGQRATTVWQPSRTNDWYAQQNWTNGVPSFSSDAVIPGGEAVADAPFFQSGPVANNLTIGNDAQMGDPATLTVAGSALTVPNSLVVGQASVLDAKATLITKEGDREIGDVLVGEIFIAGQVNPASIALRTPTATTEVQIGGALRGFDSSPTLAVGQLNGSGNVRSTMNVAGRIGEPRQGFNSISVGTIGQGANGVVTANLEAAQINGTGQSTLLVGTNFGKGNATGSLTVHDGIGGFALAQIGDGGGSGSANGSLVVGGPLDVATLEVGNKQGTGFGEVQFLPSASYSGKNFTIHRGSRASVTNFLAGDIFNSGVFSLADHPNNSSVVKIEGNFAQLSEGATEFDVRNLDPEFGYERLEVAGSTRLSGRLDIRFADGFKELDGTLELINGPSIEGSPSFRLINPPKGLAVLPSFEKGFRLELVEPVPIKFSNPSVPEPGQKPVLWSDPELWGGNVPQANNELQLINDFKVPQTINIVEEDAFAQSITLGGEGGMTLLVNEGAKITATHGVDVEAGSSFGLHKSTLFTNQLNFQRGAVFELASGAVIGDVFNAGRIDVGAFDNSRLVVEGDFVQSSTGAIEFDLLHADQFDHVVVDGTATLNGNLFINLPDIFDLPNLEPGVEIPLFTATDGLTIEDLDVHLFGPPLNGINWLLGNDGDTITMMAISADLESRGDMNGDGVRDADDIFAFSQALTDVAAYWLNTDISGGVHPLVPGDLNFDNELDLDDIEPFLDCIEMDLCLPMFEVVPEPSSPQPIWLAAIGVLLFCRRRNVR